MWHWCFSLQRCILHHGCFTLRRLIDFRLVANLFTRICSVYRIILWQRALIKVASMLLWLFEQNLGLRSSVNNWSPTNWSSNLWSCYMKLWCDISWRATNLYGQLFRFYNVAGRCRSNIGLYVPYLYVCKNWSCKLGGGTISLGSFL